MSVASLMKFYTLLQYYSIEVELLLAVILEDNKSIFLTPEFSVQTQTLTLQT